MCPYPQILMLNAPGCMPPVVAETVVAVATVVGVPAAVVTVVGATVAVATAVGAPVAVATVVGVTVAAATVAVATVAVAIVAVAAVAVATVAAATVAAATVAVAAVVAESFHDSVRHPPSFPGVAGWVEFPNRHRTTVHVSLQFFLLYSPSVPVAGTVAPLSVHSHMVV